jgi:hypothetical protein
MVRCVTLEPVVGVVLALSEKLTILCGPQPFMSVANTKMSSILNVLVIDGFFLNVTI